MYLLQTQGLGTLCSAVRPMHPSVTLQLSLDGPPAKVTLLFCWHINSFQHHKSKSCSDLWAALSPLGDCRFPNTSSDLVVEHWESSLIFNLVGSTSAVASRYPLWFRINHCHLCLPHVLPHILATLLENKRFLPLGVCTCLQEGALGHVHMQANCGVVSSWALSVQWFPDTESMPGPS